MEQVDAAESWGLPEGFVSVRFQIQDEIKSLLRPLLQAGEPVVVTLANIESTITLVGTPQRLFVVRSGTALSGVTGFSAREFPWAGVTRLTLAHAGASVKVSVGFRTSDGRTAEVGRRATMGRDAIEHAMPFDAGQGQAAFGALHEIWQHAQRTGE